MTIEEIIPKSEESYRALFDTSPDAITVFDLNFKIRAVNQRALDMLGYERPEDMIGRIASDFVIPEERQRAVTGQKKIIETGRVADAEFSMLRKDGGRLFVVVRAAAIHDDKENPEAIISIAHDITERKQAEKELAKAYQLFMNIIEFLPDATFVIDKDHKVIAWNRATERMTGVKKEEIIGMGDYAYSVPFYGEKRPILIDLIGIEHSEMEAKYNYVNKEGDTLYAEVFLPAMYEGRGAYVWGVAAPLFDMEGNRLGAVETIRDITARKKAEETLEKINYQNKLILNSASEGILGLDSAGKHIFVNPAAAAMFGYTSDELLDKKSHPLWHHSKADGAPYLENDCPIYGSCRKGIIHPRIRDEVFWRKDGTSFPVAYTSTPIVKNGSVAGAVVTFIDITERKKAEDALRKNEDNLRRLIERNPVAMAVTEKDGKFVFFNNKFIETFGYTLDDIPSVDHWWPLAYPDEHYRQKVVDSWRAAARKAIKNKNETGTQEWRVTCKNGSLRDIEFRMASLQEVNIVIYNDITERKRVEELLRHLSTIDELTGLANRRSFDTFLDEEWRRALRDKHQISMMMIDVDFFKKYNDTYGHLKGDDCLKFVAEILKGVARRPGDNVARFGGEEFVVVLSDTDKQHTVSIAEKIRMDVEGLKIRHDQSRISSYVTVSVGVASLIPQQNMSPVELIKYADEALYKAKKEGRNRTSFHE